MISSVQQKAPGVKIVFWDLGLNNEALVKKVKIIFWNLGLNNETLVKKVKIIPGFGIRQ